MAPAQQPVHIGSNLQLMLDGWLVDEMTGLTFKLHSPVTREIALKMQMPWEGGLDVSALAGRPVRLRFAMKDADLYSIQFRP